MNAFASQPARTALADGRWHFQHGPIDLVIGIDGDRDACEIALASCWSQFGRVLRDLVAELPALKRPLGSDTGLRGPVAARMQRACAPFAAEHFITPMAAVAGAVSDHLIGSFLRPGIERAGINNGGDIAFHLARGRCYRMAVLSNVDRAECAARVQDAFDGLVTLHEHLPVRGVATSGWRGRSHSLGIADSVTILARSAAMADAAATLIANAVNVESPLIERRPANTLKDDSDLGERLVTTAVPVLSRTLVIEALERGRREAERWRSRGLIHSALLFLQGESRLAASPCICDDEPQIISRSRKGLWSASGAF